MSSKIQVKNAGFHADIRSAEKVSKSYQGKSYKPKTLLRAIKA
jgi:hypothetical protein